MRVKPFLLAIAICVVSPWARGADNFPNGWTFRRPLSFKPVVTDAPGDNIGVAEFYANGAQQKDGADFRVTTSTGITVPSRVLQSSPINDFVRIAFQIRTPENPYHVWWGNPNAQRPSRELDIRRGVLAEVFTHRGGVPRNAAVLDRALENAEPVGATFVPSLFLGYNPLGPERNALIHYTGQFKIDTAIKPEFAFTVSDVGLLKIDGKEVAAQFRGGVRGRARDPQTVELAPGWHSIDVLQANGPNSNMVVVLDWRRPNEKGYTPFPPAVFAPIAPATAGPIEKVGAEPHAYVPDFNVIPEAEAFVPPDNFVPRYSFEGELPENLPNPGLTWDFGDGQVLAGKKKISHYFLKPGTYTVTMSVRIGASSTLAATRRIEVPDRMYSRFPQPPQDTGRIVQSVLTTYDVKKLAGDAALGGMLYFKGQGNTEEQIEWGRAWLQSTKGGASDQTLLEETSDLSRLLKSRKDDRGAAEVLRLASDAKWAGVLARIDLLHQYVEVLCDDLDDADAALAAVKQFQPVISSGSPEQSRRLAACALIAAIAKGDHKLAEAAAAQIPPLKGNAYNDAQIKQGVLARNIEAYIRTRDFTTATQLLNQWELDYPTAIWDGFTRTLRVKLLAAESHPDRAARIALAYAKANPGGFYAAELLYRASQHFKEAHEETQAKAAMDLLTSKYPESPYARGKVNDE
ncbi:MAG: PKD domain-containing protein [Phycisphaerae bacterium]